MVSTLLPVVYFDLEAEGKALGRVRIRLTCDPKIREQTLRICTAQQGETWRGAAFHHAGNAGQAGEYIWNNHHITPNGGKSNVAILQGLESNECRLYDEGVVTGYMGTTDFVICTRSDPSNATMRPEIGHVVAGLDLLRQAIENYACFGNAVNIIISEAGVEITDQ